MTIKDLAEMTMNYGLVCQKCVNPTPNLTWRQCDSWTPFTAYPQQGRPLQLIFVTTCNGARTKRTTLFYFAISYQGHPPTTNSFLPSTHALVAHIVLRIPRTVRPTSDEA